MKKIFSIVLLLTTIIFLFSCEKKEGNQVVLGSLYGVVTDKTTGEPIKNASVELMDIGLKAVTGDDGNYEFIKVEPGTYDLYVKKAGYKDSKTFDIPVKGDGKDKKVDVQLEKLPPALTILDENKIEIDSIDFGSEEGTTMRTFNIFNNSEKTLEWSVVQDCKWIKSISKENGELGVTETQTIVMTIDRNKLDLGDNSTLIYIVSNNGSKQLKIKARSVDVIETLDATDTDSHNVVLHGKIIRNLDPAITEYGFVYSKTETPTLNNGASKKSNSGTPQVGVYTMIADELDTETKYYARAFVTNREKTIYGNQISFTTISHVPEIIILDEPSKTATVISINYKVSGGGLPLEEVGVCWGQEMFPTKETNYLITGYEAKEYLTNITNLTPNTIYYIRIYAKNAEEEVYSSNIIIQTREGLPTVTTTIVGENVTNTSAIGGGNVIDDGGYAVIERGVCWSSLPNPTIADSKTINGSGNGYFSSTITDIDLTGDNIYYVRAYATNTNGTAYGNNVKISKENSDYKNLPVVMFGGYAYRLHPDIGAMTLSNALNACISLQYGGYDDWLLPTYEELVNLMNNCTEGWKYFNGEDFTPCFDIGNCGKNQNNSGYYWTRTKYAYDSYSRNYTYYAVYYYWNYSNTTPYHYVRALEDVPSDKQYRVRPVRKYIAN